MPCVLCLYVAAGGAAPELCRAACWMHDVLWFMCTSQGIALAEQSVQLQLKSPSPGRFVKGVASTPAGAQNDLERITKMAYSQVAIYGMNEKVKVIEKKRLQQHVAPDTAVSWSITRSTLPLCLSSLLDLYGDQELPACFLASPHRGCCLQRPAVCLNLQCSDWEFHLHELTSLGSPCALWVISIAFCDA